MYPHCFVEVTCSSSFVGTFCDSDSDCHSADEELSCREQADISRYFRVCMAKLGEGATCGHVGLFDLFRPAEEVSNYCKKGLVCKTVGWVKIHLLL